jgi:hypothetical protein
MNPSWFWGLPTRGFAYGETVLLDPGTEKPVLGVIDSGTTLLILPTIIYDNFIHEMASDFKDDHDIDMVCVRANETGHLDHCYFNNTKCSWLLDQHYSKFKPLHFVLGNY